MLASAGDMGTTGGQLLLVAGGADVDLKTQEALVAMAKAVASATAALVTNARNVAAKCEDSALQNQVIVAAKQVRERERGRERGREGERERIYNYCITTCLSYTPVFILSYSLSLFLSFSLSLSLSLSLHRLH